MLLKESNYLRMELLLYGADAVAGVVNNVLQTDFTGFEVNFRGNGYDHFDANDERIQIKYGGDLMTAEQIFPSCSTTRQGCNSSIRRS